MKQFFTLKSLLLTALIAVMGGVSPALAQEPEPERMQVFRETFDGNANKTKIDNATFTHGNSNVTVATTDAATDLRTSLPSTGAYENASGDCNVMLNTSTKNIIFHFGDELNQYKSLVLSLGYRKPNKSGTPAYVYLYTSTNNGETWTKAYTFSKLTEKGLGWYCISDIPLGDTPSDFSIKFESTEAQDTRIDDILITGIKTNGTPSAKDAEWKAESNYQLNVDDDLSITNFTNYDGNITATSDNDEVAMAEYNTTTQSIDILGISAGTATINVKGTGSETFNDLNKTITITVTSSLVDATWNAESSYQLNVDDDLSITDFTNYDGTIKATSENDEVAMAEYNSDTKSIDILGISAGTATIIVEGTGSKTYNNLNKTITITVKPEPVDATWTIADQSVANGASVKVEDVSDYDGDVTFTYAPEDIAEVTYDKTDGSFTIKGLAEGNTTVTFSGDATDNFKAFSGQTFNVSVTHVDKPSVYYQKVASQKEIKNGETYIIVSTTSGRVMSKMSDSRFTFLDESCVTSNDDKIAISIENNADNPYELTLEKQETADQFAIKSAQGYVELKSNSTTSVSISNTCTNNTTWWKLTYGDDIVKVNNVANNKRYLLYTTITNPASFRTYTVGQANTSSVTLYRKVVAAVVTEAVKVTSAGYASHYSDNVLEVPDNDGIESVYTVKFDETSKKLVASKVYAKGDKIAANTGFIVKAAEGTYNFAISGEAGEGDAENALYGDIVDNTTTDHGVATPVYYKLAKPAEKVGFFYGAAYGGPFTSKARLAYLVLSNKQAEGIRGFSFDGDTYFVTGIGNVNANNGAEKTYDLSGRRIQRAQQGGIYIVNGKKVIK